MTIYTTLGEDRGCCGHRHPTPQDALACGDRFRDEQQHRGDYSDRSVVAVEAHAPWAYGAPKTWRRLNNTELAEMYGVRSEAPASPAPCGQRTHRLAKPEDE